MERQSSADKRKAGGYINGLNRLVDSGGLVYTKMTQSKNIADSFCYTFRMVNFSSCAVATAQMDFFRL